MIQLALDERSGAAAMNEAFAKPRLANLLDHFSIIEDPREQWRVAHPLPEVLLLVVSATIASCDDFDDMAAWGEAHLDFLRRFLPFYHGVPGGRWLNILMNRIDPDLFSACFTGWACELRDDAPALIALDGKTSRRSHDRAAGKAALHLVSAFATAEKLVLGQEAVAEKLNEVTAIPLLLERLAETGALAGARSPSMRSPATRPSPSTSSTKAPTIYWRSRTTSRRFMTRSGVSSTMRRPRSSIPTATTTKATAGSSSAAPRSVMASTG